MEVKKSLRLLVSPANPTLSHPENVIEGAVVTFTDITEPIRAQAVLNEADTLRRVAVVMRESHEHR